MKNSLEVGKEDWGVLKKISSFWVSPAINYLISYFVARREQTQIVEVLLLREMQWKRSRPDPFIADFHQIVSAFMTL